MTEYLKKTTPGFIRMKELTESTLRNIVNTSSQLTECVKDIRVVSFQRPLDETPSDGPSLEAEVLIYITNSLYQSIKSRENSLALVFVKEISVAVHELNTSRFSSNPEFDAAVTQIEGDVDPCQVDDLNYCSADSSCFMTTSTDNRYACLCKDRFTDLSPHPRFPGEICSLECPDDYCSNDGYCHVDRTSNELYCTCNHWNVGSRCQYSGIVVFSVLGVIVLLLLFVVGCTAAVLSGQRRAGGTSDSSENSRHHLIHQKSSLVSSCPEEHPSIRPFRITIDNLNYASDTISHGTPVIQFTPGLVQQSSRESGDFTSHPQIYSQPQQHQSIPQVVHHSPPPETEACCSHVTHEFSNNTSPIPSPRPSISTIGVQTEDLNRSDKMSPVTPTTREVSLDKPPRGGLKVLPNDKIYSEGHPIITKEGDSSRTENSWC